ncbi:sensor histidine kinase [Alicyclobacillus mengziensis]|uniref:histidine kinase n=1 Tax=Alicyclobacillus mengziensis TaxID=2931921 RepID=A0A9X7VYX5_9BACL|nr:ATP-binding protein [Alicyclobacillus mengziensis]QSO47037.1 HAMP domain-containing protein [Alicyclobacillus mengziensis]
MSVRLKIWIAMAGLVLWMSGCYLIISHIFAESQFRHFTEEARVQSATRWTQVIERYYKEHGSFSGIQDAVTESVVQFGTGTSLEEISIRSLDGKQIANISLTPSPPDPDDSSGVTVPIVVNGKPIADAVVYDRVIEGLEVLQETTLQSVATATLVGLLLTAVIALVAGGWVSRLITKPLRSIMQGIRQIGGGNLQTKVNVRSHDEFARLAGALNEMSRQLSDAVQTRKRLVADVAHELRTPITIIQGQLDLIQDGLQPAEPSSLLPIQDEVIRLRTLIDELHQLALAESHQLTLHTTTVEFVGWVSQLTEKFRAEALLRDVEMDFHSEIKEAYIAADSHRLTQVFANLVSNALRYTPASGAIRLSVFPHPDNQDMVCAAIADTGPGIPPQQVEHIFDRFYRTEEARSRESGGLGLGLAIAKELAELHGGSIEVASKPGSGSTFTVTLPLLRRLEGESAIS